MGRRETRDATVKFLYSDNFTGDDDITLADRIDLFLSNYDGCSAGKIDRSYLYEVASGSTEHREEIDRLIEAHAANWTPERMAKLDMAILRVAIYELLYREDIPANVAINEAVELAKTYSHEDAGTFVNGILGSIYRERQ
jgi:N utilization substance protein B